MARFDVYINPKQRGYLLDVQSDLLSTINSRVVVPLLERHEAPLPARRLNPVFRIGGEEYVMVTQFLASVPLAELGQAEGSLEVRQFEITEALDMLFVGY